MLVNINKKELEQLAKYFYNIAKTLISIFDADMNHICHYPSTMCDFCTKIASVPELHNRCFCDDDKAFEMCKKTRSTYIYKCHMGLIEVATPVIYNNMIIGYLLFGQIADQKNKSDIYDSIQQLPETCGLDKDALIRSADKIRYRSKEYIESISALMEMCANYIWINNIITVRRDGLTHSISTYVNEHLSSDLSVQTICREFHVSSNTLYDFSKKNLGCSIHEYVQLCRLNKAKKLLSDSEQSVSEIAESVGFKDVNYFIRFFKKRTGVTPKKYRTRQEQEIHNK